MILILWESGRGQPCGQKPYLSTGLSMPFKRHSPRSGNVHLSTVSDFTQGGDGASRAVSH